eukprot:scaffold146770_cov16-Prasinocladus_malaysianus.AAC.1
MMGGVCSNTGISPRIISPARCRPPGAPWPQWMHCTPSPPLYCKVSVLRPQMEQYKHWLAT